MASSSACLEAFSCVPQSHIKSYESPTSGVGGPDKRTYVPELVGSVARLGYDGAVSNEDASDGYFA